jgi:hypothetical protein
MAVTADQIQAFAPEFASTPDALIDLWIALSADFVNVSALGTSADNALTLWICHALTVTQGGAASGGASAVSGQRVGDVTVQFASGRSQAAGTPGWLSGSSYGRIYLSLVRMKVGSFRAIG